MLRARRTGPLAPEPATRSEETCSVSKCLLLLTSIKTVGTKNKVEALDWINDRRPNSNKWICQSNQPAPPLETVDAQIAAAAGKPPNSFVFSLAEMPPNRETKCGTVRIADSSNFLVSKTIAATRVMLKPGGLRDMHWHPNADEWAYFLHGTARVTVFNTGPAAITADFHAGDVGYVKRALGHYVENTGNTELV